MSDGVDKGGRPMIVFDADQVAQVEALASVLNMEQIADYFSIAENTFLALKKRQPEVFAAYKRGRAKAISDVGGGLLSKALDGDTASAIFYLKTQAGWREKTEVEHSGEIKNTAPSINLVVKSGGT